MIESAETAPARNVESNRVENGSVQSQGNESVEPVEAKGLKVPVRPTQEEVGKQCLDQPCCISRLV